MHTRSIETTPSNLLPPSDRGSLHPSTAYTVSLILMSLILLSSIAAGIYTFIPKVMQPSFLTKLGYEVPCYECKYFSHNPHLKCALHPDTVLTKQAVDCRDADSGSVVKLFKR